MATFDPDDQALDFASLTDSVVVLTGGSSGIGAATVRLLHKYGAKVVFGDLESTSEAAIALIDSTSLDRVQFVPTDVRSYQDNLALFDFALNKYGRVDHAIANAGIQERPGWFDPRGGIEAVRTEPDLLAVDVNLRGVLYFANIACSYLVYNKQNDGAKANVNKSLTLLSSIAGWKETPGLFTYQASKHGVLGLMRSLRLFVPEAFPGVRVNAVCPSMTMTRMVDGIKEGWVGAGLPVNAPGDVARAIVGVCAAGPGTKAIAFTKAPSAGGSDWSDAKGRGLNGRALHVMGGTCCDIEQGLDDSQELWLGQEMSGTVEAAQHALGDGTHWIER